jgi:hypothetical protein
MAGGTSAAERSKAMNRWEWLAGMLLVAGVVLVVYAGSPLGLPLLLFVPAFTVEAVATHIERDRSKR